MNPTEACRYMADPANWSPSCWLFLPGWETAGRHHARLLAAAALDDTAEIIPTRTAEIRQENRPCKVCGEKIEPGTAYVVRGPQHVRCVGPRR